MQCNDCGQCYIASSRPITPSPVPPLLNSNISPQEEQRAVVAKYINRLRQELTRLEENEITPLSILLEKRKIERAAFENMGDEDLPSFLRLTQAQFPILYASFSQLIPRLPPPERIVNMDDSTLRDEINGIVARLDDEITTLFDALQNKLKQKRDLQKSVLDHQSILNPFRRLSAELLSEIFLYCPQGSKPPLVPEIPDAFHPYDGPLLLTQICQRWRQVAIATPRLWSAFRVRLGSKQHHEAQGNLVLLWTARSGSCPLRVCLVDTAQTLPLVTFDEDLAVKAVLASSRRWRELHIILSPFNAVSVWPALENSLEERLPLLQECSVISTEIALASGKDVIQPGSLFFRQLSTSIFRPPPRLRKFRLDIRVPLSSFHLNSNITSIELYPALREQAASTNDIISLLSSYPNLIELRATYGSINAQPPLPPSLSPSPLTHTNLHSLNIKLPIASDGAPDPNLDDLFERLTTPNLRLLIVDATRRKVTFSLDTLSTFLTRSGESLERLSLGGQLTWDAILRCLVSTPRLKALKLKVEWDGSSRTELTDAVLFALEAGERVVGGEYRPALLPNLQRLDVEGEMVATAEALLDFMHARWNPVEGSGYGRLAQMTLYAQLGSKGFVADVEKKSWGQLEALRRDGFSVTLFRNGSRVFPVSSRFSHRLSHR